ncbi:hypothetical protein TRVA0_032S01134 [Trichomonascus vanleenenianus]|uniref:Tip20p n=1 Tax=Trichomonascus vanleenenianus TaxID=2268995 RepID=UPI003ECA8420
MGSIRAALDEKFPDWETLDRELEVQSSLTKQEISSIQEKIEKEHQQVIESRIETVQGLKSFLVGLKPTVMKSVPSDREMRKHLGEIADDALGGEAIAQFEHLQTLSKGHQVLLRLHKVRAAIEELPDYLQEGGSIDKALGLYGNLAGEEKGLYVFSTSSNPVIAALAQKGLQQFELSIRRPVQELCYSKLRSFLEKSGWPKKMPEKEEFAPLFENALRTEQFHTTSPVRPEPLGAFRVLAEPLDLRFKYHFESDRDTNRSDKPEWAFNHFTNVVDENMDFLNAVVNPLLHDIPRFQDRNAMHEFIVAMLPSVYRKLDALFPQIQADANLLSHLVYETVNFDTSLKERYYFSPRHQENWRGVTGDMLAKDSRFDTWLALERETTLNRYKEIIESPNAWKIDWESVDSSETKPTQSAINLKDLLEGITEHYCSLSSVNYRLRFLLKVQLDLLDKYYTRLHESIDAFDSMRSSLSRSIGGVSAEDQQLVSGIAGLERLCRIYGSVEYIITTLEIWGQSVFFLELWDDISKLSSSSKKLDNKTSLALKDSQATIPHNEEEDGTLFDETIASYSKLKERVFLTVQSLLKKELQTAMHDYLRKSDWQPQSASTEVSSKLVRPIKTLSKELDFLRSFFTSVDYLRLSKSFGHDLQRYIWNYLVQSNVFTIAGGQQLKKDVAELWETLLLPLDSSFRKLDAAAEVLSVEELNVSNLMQSTGGALTENDIRGIIHRRR